MEREYLKCIMIFLTSFCLFMLTGIMIAERAYIMSGLCFILFVLFTSFGITLHKRLKEETRT